MLNVIVLSSCVFVFAFAYKCPEPLNSTLNAMIADYCKIKNPDAFLDCTEKKGFKMAQAVQSCSIACKQFQYIKNMDEYFQMVCEESPPKPETRDFVCCDINIQLQFENKTVKEKQDIVTECSKAS